MKVRGAGRAGVPLSTMTAYLKDGVHAAILSEDAVLLDVKGDAYHCLPGAGPALAQAAYGGPLKSGPVLNGLRHAGLTQDGLPRTVVALPPPASTTVIHQPRPKLPSVADLLAARRALNGLRRARRRGGLSAYLDLAARDGPLARDPGATATAARLFWDLLAWAPATGECLQRSAALIAFLRARGLAADWVFGVRLWPFAAHCWVQLDDVCLNDDVDHLKVFTPIMKL